MDEAERIDRRRPISVPVWHIRCWAEDTLTGHDQQRVFWLLDEIEDIAQVSKAA